jgi:hypothetical protein
MVFLYARSVIVWVFVIMLLCTLPTIILSMPLAQSETSPSEINASMLSNTTHPKVISNATSNIVSNTTKQPITSTMTGTPSLSNTAHPKLLPNESSQLTQNATAPSSTTNASVLSNTTHPKVSPNTTG